MRDGATGAAVDSEALFPRPKIGPGVRHLPNGPRVALFGNDQPTSAKDDNAGELLLAVKCVVSG